MTSHENFISLIYYLTILLSFFFFFNDTATTEIYTLSLHDALPICLLRPVEHGVVGGRQRGGGEGEGGRAERQPDRKSTRLNSSHTVISYAVFCLKKKKNRKRSLLCKTTCVRAGGRRCLAVAHITST